MVRKRWRILLWTVGALVVLAAVSSITERVQRARGFTVPAHGGRDICRVWKDDTRDAVLSRCGEACASGFVPKGDCPDEIAKEHLIALCSWDCDLYGTVWVCYSGRVIDVGAGLRVVASEGACSWRRAKQMGPEGTH